MIKRNFYLHLKVEFAKQKVVTRLLFLAKLQIRATNPHCYLKYVSEQTFTKVLKKKEKYLY